jgi:hypothetical protein
MRSVDDLVKEVRASGPGGVRIRRELNKTCVAEADVAEADEPGVTIKITEEQALALYRAGASDPEGLFADVPR